MSWRILKQVGTKALIGDNHGNVAELDLSAKPNLTDDPKARVRIKSANVPDNMKPVLAQLQQLTNPGRPGTMLDFLGAVLTENLPTGVVLQGGPGAPPMMNRETQSLLRQAAPAVQEKLFDFRSYSAFPEQGNPPLPGAIPGRQLTAQAVFIPDTGEWWVHRDDEILKDQRERQNERLKHQSEVQQLNWKILNLEQQVKQKSNRDTKMHRRAQQAESETIRVLRQLNAVDAMNRHHIKVIGLLMDRLQKIEELAEAKKGVYLRNQLAHDILSVTQERLVIDYILHPGSSRVTSESLTEKVIKTLDGAGDGPDGAPDGPSRAFRVGDSWYGDRWWDGEKPRNEPKADVQSTP